MNQLPTDVGFEFPSASTGALMWLCSRWSDTLDDPKNRRAASDVMESLFANLPEEFDMFLTLNVPAEPFVEMGMYPSMPKEGQNSVKLTVTSKIVPTMPWTDQVPALHQRKMRLCPWL